MKNDITETIVEVYLFHESHLKIYLASALDFLNSIKLCKREFYLKLHKAFLLFLEHFLFLHSIVLFFYIFVVTDYTVEQNKEV